MTNRKAAFAVAGVAASNDEVGESSGDGQLPHPDNVTYADIVPMTRPPDDTPEISDVNQEEQPQVLYSELTLQPTHDDVRL